MSEDIIKFRFKTKSEFVKEFGTNWRSIIQWSKELDYLFGKEIQNRHFKKILKLVITNEIKMFGYYIKQEYLFAPIYKEFIKVIIDETYESNN